MGEEGPSRTTVAKLAGIVLAAIALLGALPFVAQLLPAEDLFRPGAVAFLGGVVLFVLGIRAYGKRQLIRDTPTSRIRSLSIGTAEIQGEAHPLTEPLVSPLTHTPACMFEFVVEEEKTVERSSTPDLLSGRRDRHHRQHDRKEKEWQTVLTIKEGVPFCIDDGTGRVPVETDGAELLFDVEDEAEVDAGEPPPDALPVWAEEHANVERPEIPLPGRLGEIAEAARSGELDPEGIDPREAYPEAFDPGSEETSDLDPGDVKLASLIYGRQQPEGPVSDGTDRGSGSFFDVAKEVVSTGKEFAEAASRSSGERYLTGNTSNKRRFEERVLGVGETAYVFGAAQRLPEADSVENVRNLVLGDDPSTGRFLVSDRSLQRLLDDQLVRSALYFGGAAVLLVYGIVALMLRVGLP